MVTAFVTILAVVMILSWIAARILKTMLAILLLGWVDRAAGATIGLLLGGIAATAIVSITSIVPSEIARTAVSESTLAEPLIENMDIVYALLPSEFDRAKDLVRQGKDLLDQSAMLLEASGKAQDLLLGGTDLLQTSGNLDELLSQAQTLSGHETDSLMIGFTNFGAYSGHKMVAVFDATGGIKFGPLSTSVLNNGVAVLAIAGLTKGVAYEMTYYLDGNDNERCDDHIGDVKGTLSIPATATQAGVMFNGDMGTGGGLCDMF